MQQPKPRIRRISSMTILIVTFAVTLLAFTLFWFLSLKRRDASVVDFWWGPGFALTGWIAFVLAEAPQRQAMLWLLVPLTLWALRLGWYMTKRHKGVEDARYAVMREAAGAGWPRRSLFVVFWLQAVIQWLASSPALTVALATPRPSDGATMAILAAGLMFFAVGFALEIAADAAVNRFKADPANNGRLLTTGLHARIRHPNYLGEIILQAGFALIAFGFTFNPLAALGPLLMIGLLIKLSGVPMLDEQLRKRPGYDAWAAKTGALFPRLRQE
jgi:steroid 5-alpha reductase family enzyme